MPRLIIDDIYERIGSVLQDLKVEIGPTAEFAAELVVQKYEWRYPDDKQYMEQRKNDSPGAHSLGGYLDGMLTEYCKRQIEGENDGPRIEWLDKMKYRFHPMMSEISPNRRQFVAGAAASVLAAGVTTGRSVRAAERAPLGKADHCIMLWLGGGAGQMDTFDPKRKGDPKAKQPGSYYDAIDTVLDGVQLCEPLSSTAKILDRCNLIRTVHHDVIDEHAAAVNRMHTGRDISGTIVYPSIGSIVAKQRGAAADGVPAYVIMGYPNLTRGPGFLGAKHSYLYLTETKAGPAGLARPNHISPTRAERRNRLLAKLRETYLKQHAGEDKIADYDAAAQQASKLAGPEFMRVFDLEREPSELRNRYGGEFGQRCLLSRRLIERGVRFIEVAHNLNFVNGTGWDVHNAGIENQHLLIQELDTALSTLILDLEDKNLLDKTLIVVSTEFGRPAGFDGGGGRGHHSKSFSAVLAGGGVNTGQAIGTTDELSMKIVERPVSVPDIFATIFATLGIDPSDNLYAGDRPVPITDMGKPLNELFA